MFATHNNRVPDVPIQIILSCARLRPLNFKRISYVLANIFLLVGFAIAQHSHGTGTISHAIKSPDSKLTRPRAAGANNMAPGNIFVLLLL